MLQELRFYRLTPGRVADNEARHRDTLPPLLARHGISVVGRWNAVDGDGLPLFAYMMAYPDFGARERQWDAFYADDDWWTLRERTNAGSEIVLGYELHFLKPNGRWRFVDHGAYRAGDVHELLFLGVVNGKQRAAADFVMDALTPAIERQEGRVMLFSEFVSGPSLPRAALMIAWADARHREAARVLLDADPQLARARQDELATTGEVASIGATQSWLLAPTPYALPEPSLGAVLLEDAIQ